MSRNHQIWAWLCEWDGRPFLASIAEGYAKHIRCPVCEVDPLYGGDPDFLEWVWQTYGRTIQSWNGYHP